MNDQSRMLVRAATGPIILITVGTLFALEKFTPYRFGQTWPVLLIIIGILKLLGGGPRRGKRWRMPPQSSSPQANPFPPIPPQPPGSTWKTPGCQTGGNVPPRSAAPTATPPYTQPPYTNPGEPMPDMTPPPPPRPGERR